MLAITLLTLLTTCANDLYRQDNLVAWCIVPFDAKQRGPAERVEMLKRLGITRYAYDWRDKHLPTFETEVRLLQREGITLQAVWFPTALNQDARTILDVLKRNKVVTELWVSLADPAGPNQAAKLATIAVTLEPIIKAAQEIGCTVCLYNHGGWAGDPDNQLAILQAIKSPSLGLVYNLHHGHAHLERFPKVMQQLKPYLKCITLNGMVPQGDQQGKKILPLGAGSEDLTLLRTIRDSGYSGRIAILGHVHEVDVEDRLKDNLDGLNWLKTQLKDQPAGSTPKYRTYRP